MPQGPTDFERVLDHAGHNRMRVRFSGFRGRIQWFVVQYETYERDSDRWFPVVRYDTAHGRAHRDMLFRNGRREKLWLEESLDYNEAFGLAEREIEQNWELYREAFYRDRL